MKDEYDFTKAVRKNPYKEKMKNGYSITVHYPPANRNNENKRYKADVKKLGEMTTAIDLSSTVAEQT